ncbi:MULTISPECIES: hypothetical protein [unclassified Pseudomonas]|uniref:hypothetical protein n=1 Tax=unclassified Pseudomonas TaxID=196821 RepID=UPI000C8812BF|nr:MULTISPECIES: hypothetical protein [unclassified Pseudomonas]PNB82709.1 hypothetical protein C1X30_03130 [Pseudomonas sp. FW305-BF6]MCH4898976.1 hypothetical protein [Pseudomonas sp. B707]PNA06631.1 hypothetical protein C1X28_07420 [Pseudomonas sp. FW305-BF15]PNB52317.1 hypothetical protein C1X29_01490 [Pseudomonas sp. GW456-12-10-14-LB2]TEA58387.1 hypothetical protein EIY71_28375 [Pseudomonas sp. CH235]
MRWLFLLLLVLNVFYYVWHQQEAPLRAKDVTPLSLYRGSQQDIRLLSEAGGDASREKRTGGKSDGQCLYVGGLARPETAQALEQRLTEIGAKALPSSKESSGGSYWFQITPETQRLLGDAQLQNLSKEFNELKHKIMLCEGVAPTE